MLGEILDVLRVDCKLGIKAMFRDLIGVHKTYYTDFYLKNILDFLEKNNIQVTFFISAKKISQKKKIIDRILDKKHEVSSHSYNHLLLNRLSYKRLREEFSLAEKEFDKIGLKPKGFRPPFLGFDRKVLDIVNEFGFNYISTVEGGKIFKYKNGITEIPIIKPYDWQGLIAENMNIQELIKIWKDKNGSVYLIHPWIFNVKRYNKFLVSLFEPNKNYRIDHNLKDGKIAASFDVYFR